MFITLFGLITGLALGLTGGGGSILAVPMLIYGAGIEFNQAVTIALLVVGTTAMTGFLPRLKSGEVEFTAGLILAITGMLLAPIGSAVGMMIQSNVLIIAFASFMLIVASLSWLGPKIQAA